MSLTTDIFKNNEVQEDGRKILERYIRQHMPSHRIKSILGLFESLLSAAKNEGHLEALNRAQEIIKNGN